MRYFVWGIIMVRSGIMSIVLFPANSLQGMHPISWYMGEILDKCPNGCNAD